jgi:Histidine kinase-, DNA gyrase B-, and HSP90-like ATPase
MDSLRDIGYDFPGAIADLIDNSIDAGARRVDVTFCFKGEASFIRIADDGCGMTERTVEEAMRYGTDRGYDAHELGRFGLGLKTASLSQCRRLTVATRTSPKGRIAIRRWDLDRVARSDSWDLERRTPSECPPYLTGPLRGGAGTVVLWERLDRVLGYRNPASAAARGGLDALAQATLDHLSMVFHRFLSGEAAARRTVEIHCNGEPLTPWDPFARREPKTQRLSVQRIRIKRDGATHLVRVQPHILPNQVMFSTPAAHAAASGPKKWNRQQGFYIYRRDRMIQSGGWNRLRTMDEHSKLARIALDIPPGLEDAFQINVSKMQVVIPEEIRPQLRTVASGVVTMAQEAYRKRVRLISNEKPAAATDVAAQSEAGLWQLGDHWSLILDVLERELAEHPEVLDRILVALVNARPPAPAETAAGT